MSDARCKTVRPSPFGTVVSGIEFPQPIALQLASSGGEVVAGGVLTKIRSGVLWTARAAFAKERRERQRISLKGGPPGGCQISRGTFPRGE